MPIAAELRRHTGEVVKGLPDPSGGTFDAAGDFDDILPLVGPEGIALEYRVLGSVDPVGLVVVEADRMDDLLRDIDLALTLNLRASAKRGLERLRVMALRCTNGHELCICFVGD